MAHVPKIILIAAMDKYHAIGIKNDLPWYLPADLTHFKQTTLGKSVLMGRSTFESIGKPLPGRHNIVISRNTSLQIADVTIVHSIKQALTITQSKDEIFIIGGASLYQQTIEIADKLMLTLVDTVVKGDTFFPAISPQIWHEISCETHQMDDKNAFNYRFVSYQKANTH